jgi:hypothetical protein
MTENEISKIIVDSALAVHRELGPGLLETVYEVALAHELKQRGLNVQRQVPVPIKYHGMVFDEAFRADLIVHEKVIVELKWFWPWLCGNWYFRYPCLKNFFHNCLITNDLKVAKA